MGVHAQTETRVWRARKPAAHVCFRCRGAVQRGQRYYRTTFYVPVGSEIERNFGEYRPGFNGPTITVPIHAECGREQQAASGAEVVSRHTRRAVQPLAVHS